MKTADVGVILDEGQWTGYQKLLVAATALTIILDGLDNQLLAAAVPAMMREWHLQRSAFAFVLSSGLFGMMIGGAIGGYIGDRIGRRVALLGSVVSFGALTLLVSFAGGVTTLTALRFFAGLGLGGAMPNAAALSSEYVPLRHRPFAVTLTIVCIPLGGTLAGMTGAQILPHYGWRALFLVGGIVPLLLAALLLNVLPESPRYLARQRQRWRELVVLPARRSWRASRSECSRRSPSSRCWRGPAVSSTPCRQRCMRSRRTCIQPASGQPASAPPWQSAASAASYRRTPARGRSTGADPR